MTFRAHDTVILCTIVHTPAVVVFSLYTSFGLIQIMFLHGIIRMGILAYRSNTSLTFICPYHVILNCVSPYTSNLYNYLPYIHCTNLDNSMYKGTYYCSVTYFAFTIFAFI